MNKYQRRYEKRKLAGSCVKCGGLRDNDNSLTCNQCYQAKADRRKNYRRNGFCQCGNEVIESKCCEDCLKRSREYQRNKKATQLAKGLCTHCDNPIIPGNISCRVHCLRFVAHNNLNDRTLSEYIDDLLIQQDKKCAYCNAPIDVGSGAELDHILPKKRFLELQHDKTNVQWLCTACNTAKSNLTELEFMNWLKRISSSLQIILQN